MHSTHAFIKSGSLYDECEDNCIDHYYLTL